MNDARFQKSDSAIRNALLALLKKRQLASITMSELAKEAGVSRSTLYAHFSNVQDVFGGLVHDFAMNLRPLVIHLRCNECSVEHSASQPFCIALRTAGKYLPLVKDARFLATFFEQLESEDHEDRTLSTYRTLGLSEAQARAVFRFQMSGCYAVALSEVPPREWIYIQQTLDTFIRGGMHALRLNA